MIQIDKIQAGLFGGVGFRDSDLTGYNIVNTANKVTTSGLTFQDGSELVTIKNIKLSQENPSISDEQFNTLLERMQKAVILDVCNRVINGKSDFIKSINLYPFEKSFDEKVSVNGKFVGFQIVPNLGNIICRIPWVELSFDSVVEFNIYLYNSNLPKTPIQTKLVTTVAGESKIIILDWVIADDLTYKGGSFYLGYFENDLGEARAFKKDHDIGSLRIRTPYFYVEPINLTYLGTTINVKNEVYVSETHGLNIGIDIHNDYTELILRNKNMFWNAIQLQMHEKVIMMIKYSTRENPNTRISSDNIKYADLELYGNKEAGIVGIQKKLSNAIETLQKALFYKPVISMGTLS